MPAARGNVPAVHIGMPKTATKTLQWRIFSQHSEIYYLGRYDGPQFRKQYGKLDACRDARVQKLMHEIAYTRFHSPDFDLCKALAAEVLATAAERDLVPVWSWESYSTDILANRRIRARNLKRVFGDANIIITIRHPVTLLESAFLQQLKRDNVGPGASRKLGVFYCTINEWLRRELKRDVAHHLEYGETIKYYLQTFGRERVHVLLFEDLLRDSAAFFTRVCQIIGVSPDEGVKLVSREQDNTAWTQTQLDLLRKIQSSWLESIRYRFAKRKQRRDMLALDRFGAPKVTGPKATLGITSEWRDRILEMTRDDNLWLSETFNLPLQEHGYLK